MRVVSIEGMSPVLTLILLAPGWVSQVLNPRANREDPSRSSSNPSSLELSTYSPLLDVSFCSSGGQPCRIMSQGMLPLGSLSIRFRWARRRLVPRPMDERRWVIVERSASSHHGGHGRNDRWPLPQKIKN